MVGQYSPEYTINAFNDYPVAAIYDNGILYVFDGSIINKVDFASGQIIKTVSISGIPFSFGNTDGQAGNTTLTGFALTDQQDVYYYITNYWQYINVGTSSFYEYSHAVLLPVAKP